MKALFILPGHFLKAIAGLVRPGGARAIVAVGALLRRHLSLADCDGERMAERYVSSR